MSSFFKLQTYSHIIQSCVSDNLRNVQPKDTAQNAVLKRIDSHIVSEAVGRRSHKAGTSFTHCWAPRLVSLATVVSPRQKI